MGRSCLQVINFLSVAMDAVQGTVFFLMYGLEKRQKIVRDMSSLRRRLLVRCDDVTGK
jgi:hypothetical protein